MKRLSEKLKNELSPNGVLSKLFKVLKDDVQLDVELRKNYISIYYRGGQLLKISEAKKSDTLPSFRMTWDEKYISSKNFEVLDPIVTNQKEVDEWEKKIPLLKAEMTSFWENGKKRTIEKFIQQDVVINERLTNYEIVDFEYQKGANARFDLLGINKENNLLSFIELKQGETALSSALSKNKKGDLKMKSGLFKHFKDIIRAIENKEDLEEENSKINTLITEKEVLKLKTSKVKLKDTNQYEIVFVLANYNKKSEYLKRELIKIREVHQNLTLKPIVKLIFMKYLCDKKSPFVEFEKEQKVEVYNALEYAKDKGWK